MTALIIGAGGLLGHKLDQPLAASADTFVTLRQPLAPYAPLRLFEATRVIDRIGVGTDEDLSRAFSVAHPDVVINAVGIVKQRHDAHAAVQSISINALLPHRLA